MVLQCTGSACEIIASPISNGAAASESCSAAVCPARVTNKELQTLTFAAHHIVFLSPPLTGLNALPKERCCVGSSFVAFFCDPTDFLYATYAFRISFSFLDPAD